MSETESEHVDLRADTPIIADLGKLRGIPNIHIGNLAYIHAVDRLPDGRYIAYLGVSEPRDTSEAAGENEITFLNYAPIGAMYARPIERDGDRYYAIDIPDRDAIDRACKARKDRENERRAAVFPAVSNLLADSIPAHADATATGNYHRNMALAFRVVQRELERRMDAPYRGQRRWSKTDRRDPVDLENTEEPA